MPEQFATAADRSSPSAAVRDGPARRAGRLLLRKERLRHRLAQPGMPFPLLLRPKQEHRHPAALDLQPRQRDVGLQRPALAVLPVAGAGASPT